MSEAVFPLAGRRVWVAGHRGMVGSAIVRRLAGTGCEVLTVGRETVDLRRQEPVERWIGEQRPDAIVLAAATVGGAGSPGGIGSGGSESGRTESGRSELGRNESGSSTSSRAGDARPGAPPRSRMQEHGAARVKLACQDAGVASKDASGRSR